MLPLLVERFTQCSITYKPIRFGRNIVEIIMGFDEMQQL